MVEVGVVVLPQLGHGPGTFGHQGLLQISAAPSKEEASDIGTPQSGQSLVMATGVTATVDSSAGAPARPSSLAPTWLRVPSTRLALPATPGSCSQAETAR